MIKKIMTMELRKKPRRHVSGKHHQESKAVNPNKEVSKKEKD